MGSSLSKAYDDYERYEILCGKCGVEPKDIDKYKKHEEKLMKMHGWEKTYFGYQKVNYDTTGTV